MSDELTQDKLVDFFKKEMKALPFVDKDNYPNIERNLDVLIDGKQRRFQKAEAAKWLWKYLVEKSLGDITDNLRGFRELCRYFDEYADYEDLLFAIDKKHRDHVIHPIWVMLIGFYLMKHFTILGQILYADVQGSWDEKTAANIQSTTEAIKKHETSLWCLIALTHDLGYPIQKTISANQTMEKMINNFGFLARRQFDYSFTIVHQTAIDELLNTISSIILWNPTGRFTIEYGIGSRLDYAKSFEQLDHGIMSAYLLQAYLDFICDIKQSVTVGNIPGFSLTSTDMAANYAILIVLLSSISWHTNKYGYSSMLNILPMLLVICDELDEFSRYTRSSKEREWIEVGCRTEFECDEHSVQIKHTFANKEAEEDIEPFFKGKVRRLCNLFELKPDKITKVLVICNDIRKSPDIQLLWEKTLSTDAMGIAKRTPGKSTSNIEEYLEGTENLYP